MSEPDNPGTTEDCDSTGDCAIDRHHGPRWKYGKRGLRENHYPFHDGLTLKDPARAVDALQLKGLSTGTVSMAAVLVANLGYVRTLQPSAWVHYSRDRNHYRRSRRSRDPDYTLGNITGAVEALQARGVIEHQRTAPSPSATLRSHIRATPELLAILPLPRAEDYQRVDREVIVLRNDDGDPIDYRETDAIKRLRADVAAHNRFLAGFEVRVEHPEVSYDEHGFLQCGQVRVDPQRRTYRRVYRRNFSRLGRWYGPFWQNLPKRARAGLLIAGAPTVELDFRACHLRLLCARAGLPLTFSNPDFDPYAIEGLDRASVKSAFNILINADSSQAAVQALAETLRSRGNKDASQFAREVIAAVRGKFPALQRYWCTGIGLRLQNDDAEICARVQRTLRRDGIPTLSVHDSFVVPQEAECRLRDVMECEMEAACARLRGC